MTTTTHYGNPHALAALKDAARLSYVLLVNNGTNPQSGRINGGDPLHSLIQGDGQASALARNLTEQITGKKIARGTGPDTYLNTAPGCRAALRRWAAREESAA